MELCVRWAAWWSFPIASPPRKTPRAPAASSVALRAALKAGPALWFGWSGERVGELHRRAETHRVDDIDVVTLDLEDVDYDEYYNGYANATLWPLFHSRTDLAEYDRSFGEGYARVNRRFAEALAPLLRPDDLVWVHDYHLIPLGRELRRLGVKNRSASSCTSLGRRRSSSPRCRGTPTWRRRCSPTTSSASRPPPASTPSPTM